MCSQHRVHALPMTLCIYTPLSYPIIHHKSSTTHHHPSTVPHHPPHPILHRKPSSPAPHHPPHPIIHHTPSSTPIIHPHLPPPHPTQVLVLNEVDRLSKDAQHSLRRTMEKYSSACRLVMACTNASKVIDPVRSRCLAIRVAAPTQEQVMHVLQV